MLISALATYPSCIMDWKFFLFLWDLSVVISIVPSVFLVTYQAIFNASIVWHWVFIYAGDVIFIISLCLKFFRSYTDDRGEVVSEKRLIIFHYLRTSFFYDLASSIPLEIIPAIINVDDLNYFVALLRLNRSLRLYPVWAFICKRTLCHS